MSEEILKALMELFALIIKQDGGVFSSEREYVLDFLKKQITTDSVNEYIALFDQQAGPVIETVKSKETTSPSVRDSVKILGICKKINRTLNQEQKVVVLMRLFELVNADRQFTPQRINIINTVSEVFRISSSELSSIEQFVRNDEPADPENTNILYLIPGDETCPVCQRLMAGYHNTRIIFIRVASVDLYFLRYISLDQLYLNGLPIRSGSIYTFASGASLKSQHGRSIYYSDISASFLSAIIVHKISFNAEKISHRFREGYMAVDNIDFSAEEGKLIGILGASGSGKTTLLNIFCGIQKPTSGSVTINGLDLFTDKQKLEGVIGYVPQDDLLLEDLTVFENLYYAACQCFRNKSHQEIKELADQMLISLGLFEKRGLKVGSPLNKVISGGQRKRLNIALELIREPQLLFLDEPTSGLSSRDSENLMDLLRDLALKGKLIFTVIHQPSSEIFKMFDKVLILDQNGCMAYSGNPVDSVIYFKTLDAQINSDIGECPSCGNVNPEMIFNIIEAQVVDEFGKYTEKRKVQPKEWANIFNSRFPFKGITEIKDPPYVNLQRPGFFGQLVIYFKRDLKSKLANRQYVLVTLLEAPLLGFILSFIIRYIPDPESDIYVFAENENIPIYIFMSIIVSLFLGLTISAEEIFRDRKILRREHFLNLSRHSYLLSKVFILMGISAIQTSLFLIIANPILGIKGMYSYYWLALFTTSFCANMLGLNISASFNSAITIYIIIPLLIIPMMVLSGAMFPFDKLNRQIGSVEKVPVIAELMPTRWSYEALIVAQFKDNPYSKIEFDREKETFFLLQKQIQQAEFDKVHRIKALREALDTTMNEYNNKTHERRLTKLQLLRNETAKLAETYNLSRFTFLEELNQDKFTSTIGDSLSDYLGRLDKHLSMLSNSASSRRDRFMNMNKKLLGTLEKEYYNYKLEEIVTKPYERNKILVHNNSLIQNTNPIFQDSYKSGLLGFRTHFYAPNKYFLGAETGTFTFNISLVLVTTLFLYLLLYYELPGKFVKFIDNLKIRKLAIKTLVI